MRKLLLFFITVSLLASVSFSANKEIALPKLPSRDEIASQFANLSKEINQQFEQAKKVTDLQFANMDEIIELLDGLTVSQIILYRGKEWIVTSIYNIEGLKTIQLERFPKPISPLRKELLAIKVKKANPKMYDIKQATELTFLGKVALGAFAVGIGGAFLAATFAPAYLNHVYESATPWLDSLRNQFQNALSRFKSYSRSK